jgi:hypothetical protein
MKPSEIKWPLKRHTLNTLLAAVMLFPVSDAAEVKKPAAPAMTNPAGQQLLKKYSEMLKSLQAEIAGSLPKIEAGKGSAILKAYADEEAAKLEKDPIAGLAKAQQLTLTAATPVLGEAAGILASDRLDKKLVRCAVLANATPRGLAEFAQQGKEQQELVDKLLADDGLMLRMLEAGGAKGGNYGRAMQIYTGIQKASQRAGSGILGRLALGTSLELAEVKSTEAEGGTTPIDPIKRYLSYEKAFLNGELDPAFKDMTVWECRMITNAPETDEELVWGREMLRNYRPDIVFEPDYKWRYSKIVRTDVPYKDPVWEPDAPTTKMQQLVNGGGKCGPRAWFGRFALRCFGIPVWGVKQKGHAALSHWTPEGWTINFGAHWRTNWWEDRGGEDFLLESQAREHPADYAKVLRAQWIGDALGEKKTDGRRSGIGGLWNVIALNQKRSIVATAKPREVALAGEDLAESNVSSKAEFVMKTEIRPDDRKISVGRDGVITIPAASCSKPVNNTANIQFMKSFSGGMQLHVREGEAFEYVVEAPTAGRYVLTAKVVSIHKDQQLSLTSDGLKTPLEIPIPYTLGKWEDTKPLAIELVKGRNVLRFSRKAPNSGVTVKQFTLRPAN